MHEIKITLPLPNKNLSQNARVHWAAKARYVKQARYDGGLAAREALGRNEPPQWNRAETQVTFYCRTKHERDGDNFLGMCKSYFDSFADVGIVVKDSGFRHLPVQFRVDADQRVEIVIREIERGEKYDDVAKYVPDEATIRAEAAKIRAKNIKAL